MSTKAVHETAEKVSVSTGISNFLVKNRTFFIAVIIALLVAFVAFVAITIIIDGKNKASIEKTEKTVAEWLVLKNGSDSAALLAGEDKILGDFAAIIKTYGKSYASARAHLASAEIYYSRKDWKNAQEQYAKAAELAPKVYNTGINFYNAAVCADELGNADDAVKFFKAASETKNFVFATRAMFNIGRVEEQRGNKTEAIAAYKKLSADHPDDEWTKLAKSRIIVLEIN